MTEEKPKRTWHYLQPPKSFGMSPCQCGNHDTQWSEYAKHNWCEKCQIDFIPECAGVFDGPIPIVTSLMLGMNFDRMNLVTGKIEPFELDEMGSIIDPPRELFIEDYMNEHVTPDG